MVNLEDKWRAEFNKFIIDNDKSIKYEMNGTELLLALQNAYLSARRKAQEEIVRLILLYSEATTEWNKLNIISDGYDKFRVHYMETVVKHQDDLTKVQNMHDELLKLIKRAKPWVESAWSNIPISENKEHEEWLKEVGEII